MPVCSTCGRESVEGFAFCPHCGTAFAEAAPPREQRKTVTVLFCDVTGSTALGEKLDPEPLRALLARYFERMKRIVESHGGTVEKFIGDAVMAVFGVPVVHEDDALRALRAAQEMRDAFPELGVQGRIGITTGEVVTGTGERLATGDAVNVAARLEQAAAPGEVLIGEETMRLAPAAVETQAVEPLTLKGKAEPVAAYRLLSVSIQGSARPAGPPMVGRGRELRMLADAWERVTSERSCHLFTILGPAGVGKSRLAAEFLAGVQGATVVRGRCLPYGEGITYWPVVEVIKQLPEVELDEVAAETIRGLLGDGAAITSSDEIAWAVRKLLEAAAAAQPIVCVLDDLHWGEETFLDLVEHVADLSREAPILLLCMARPDLLDRRTGWGGGKVNATTVLLEPLAPEETDRLVASLAEVDDVLRARISEAAEGNPLFVEEMVAMLRDSPDGEISVPPTIQALLAARIDQLDPRERDVLQCGSVEGRVFHRGAVQALAPEEPRVAARLTSLVRKELVRPDTAQLAGEDAFRFRHLLIRDAAYDALPKAVRAELHDRFAAWLEEHGPDLVELDEILGYHFEQAWRYRQELGTADDGAQAAARRRLTAAGRRAMLRQDHPAAVKLLRRAVALVPSGEIDIALEIDLMNALFFAGHPEDAQRYALAVAERAAAASQPVAELCARIEEGMLRIYVEPEDATEKLAALVDGAMPLFEASADDFALFVGYSGRGQVAHMRAHMDAQLEAVEQALAHARRIGLTHLESSAQLHLGTGRLFGTTPVSELLAWLDSMDEQGLRHPGSRNHRASALAMVGRFDEARSIVAQLRVDQADRGARMGLGLTIGHASVDLELLAGDPAAAAEFGREGCRLLEELGEQSWLSTAAGMLAQALYALDRLEEAEAEAARAAELGAQDDAMTQMLWRQVKAKVHARRGESAEAESLAREAVTVGEGTDLLNSQGDAYADLAEVLTLGGKRDEARAALEQALERFGRKGNLVMAERMRARLAELL